MLDGILGGDAGGETEFAVLIPPKGTEGELLTGDGAADVHRDARNAREGGIAEVVAHGLAGGLIENDSVSSLLRLVIDKKDHGSVERSVPKTGVGQEQIALKRGLRFLWGQVRHPFRKNHTGCSVK